MSKEKDLEDEIKASDAEEVVSLISFPRLVGSEGSSKAVEIIVSKFKDIGINLDKEPFQATKFWTTTATQGGTLLAFILTVLMLSLSIIAPEWNLLIIGVILGLALWGLNKMAGGELKLIGTPIDTENLLAKIPAENEKKGVILLMGHHDSKSQVLTTIQRSAAFTIGGLSILIIVLLYLVQGILSLVGNPIPSWLLILSHVFAGLIMLCTLALTFNATQNKSPGALDNASSVAALYMLGKYFSQYPLKNHEIWLLITGAEEVGMLGAHEFAKVHGDELDKETTICLNYDMIGRKGCPVEVMETEGFPKPKPVSKRLNGLARKLSQDLGYDFNGFYLPTGAATDRFVIAKLGIDAMDFVNQKAAFQTHTIHDTLERFDPELAKKFIVVSALMIKEIDEY